MITNQTIAFTGGGTAGHVIPAIPIMEYFLQHSNKLVFIGSKSGLERRLVEHLNIEYRGISTGKLRRYLSIQNILDAFRIPIGMLQALSILLRFQPRVLFSKGGYVAFPVVFSAWLLRIPVIAHESDLTPGLSTRLCTPFIKTQCVTFESTKSKARRVIATGTPIRGKLVNGNPQRARQWLGKESRRPLIVVVGGSLGATAINTVIRDCIPDLVEDYSVVHVCGKDNVDESLDGHPEYWQFEYINEEWGDVLALADIVISRAGANALYELLSLQKPNILIPLPKTSSRGDQIENAELAQSHGWSVVIPQDHFNKKNLLEKTNYVHQNRAAIVDQLKSFEGHDSVALISAEIARVVS